MSFEDGLTKSGLNNSHCMYFAILAFGNEATTPPGWNFPIKSNLVFTRVHSDMTANASLLLNYDNIILLKTLL